MKEIIARTLRQAGFIVTEYTNGLLISLKSCKVSTMEVNAILFDKLEIRPGLSSVPQGVFLGTVTLQ